MKQGDPTSAIGFLEAYHRFNRNDAAAAGARLVAVGAEVSDAGERGLVWVSDDEGDTWQVVHRTDQRASGRLVAVEPPLPDGAFGAMGGMLTTIPDLARYVGALHAIAGLGEGSAELPLA